MIKSSLSIPNIDLFKIMEKIRILVYEKVKIMTRIKQHIINDIQSLNNPNLLGQIYDFLKLISKHDKKAQSNRAAVLGLAGSIDDAEAQEVQEIIDGEFNNIEGEW